MELYSIIDNFRPKEDGELLRKAEALKPVLFRKTVRSVRIFYLKERYGREFVEILPEQLNDRGLKKGDNLCFDFGEHCVGYLKILLNYVGCHPDAPAYIKLKFAEQMDELSQCSADYSGWISKSWIQEEYIHLDELPCEVEPARRFAFRFLKITVLDTSKKYSLKVQDIACETETSADPGKICGIRIGSDQMDRIYDVGISTLKNCMQEVFEDGPKRDRRLWVGDLRLEALACYAGIPNTDLVKRCLYLFAGSRFPDGRISAGIFTRSKVEADDTWFFDYSLLYVVTLEEYLEKTGDQEALTDLYSTAMLQIDLAAGYFSKAASCIEVPENSIFIDWCENLDKSAAALAVLIYAIRYAVRLAERMRDTKRIESLLDLQESLLKCAAGLWDDKTGCYLSNGQCSVATQVWMVLAGVPEKERARDLMGRVMHWTQEPRIRTPYMQHYYIMALLETSFKKEAAEHMMYYWGSMIDAGADTYYEIWDPEHPDASPYGGKEVLSFCHAWSCTPVWLIRNYFCSELKS